MLDAEIARLRAEGVPKLLATRSQVVRVLLSQGLSDDAKRTATRELIKSVWYILQQSLGQAVPKIIRELQVTANAKIEEIEDAWDAAEGTAE